MNPQKISKIATITILFWFLKIVATTLGETLGDYISMTLNLGYLTGIAITAVLFLAFVYKQVRSKKYHPISFWLVIIATTTLGTEISDFIDRSLHLGYTLGSLLLFAGLGITLLIWHRKYKSIEVAAITESNKEILFWITVLFSNSLGTAFGDYLSDVVGFSYLQGAMVTSAIILLVVALHYLTKINEVFLFWLAFVFTRPFGATFGDFLTKPIAKGGLDLGTLQASLISILLMTALLFFEIQQLKASQKQ